MKIKVALSLALGMLILNSVGAQNKDLFQLAIDGSPQQLRQAIRNGADIKVRNKYGETVLMTAAGNNQDPAVISLLLDEGAELNARDRFGETALMHAASTSHNPQVIDALLRAGADGKVRSAAGETAFEYARSNRFLDGSEVFWKLADAQY